MKNLITIKYNNKILTLITIFSTISIFIMINLVLFYDIKNLSSREYLNIADYFSYFENIMLWLLFIISFINSILMIIYVFLENNKKYVEQI